MRDVKMTCPRCGSTHGKRYYPNGQVKCLECKKRSFFIDWYPTEIQKEAKEEYARKKQMAK